MKSENKMIELIEKLRGRNNQSYKFFEGLLIELNNEDQSEEVKEKLASCFGITQYANFTPEEEKLLAEIIDDNT